MYLQHHVKLRPHLKTFLQAVQPDYELTVYTAGTRAYAEEITTPEFGCGLDGVLRTRGDALSGILNGVDLSVWNPKTDPHIEKTYGPKGAERKKPVNRNALRSRFGLLFLNRFICNLLQGLASGYGRLALCGYSGSRKKRLRWRNG